MYDSSLGTNALILPSLMVAAGKPKVGFVFGIDTTDSQNDLRETIYEQY